MGGYVEDPIRALAATQRRRGLLGTSGDQGQLSVRCRPGAKIATDVHRAPVTGEQKVAPLAPRQLQGQRRRGSYGRVERCSRGGTAPREHDQGAAFPGGEQTPLKQTSAARKRRPVNS